jgi:cell wall assembly regulator SMI1
MEKIWNQIDFWLRANVPDIHSDLLAGATDEEIYSAEEHMDVKFPEDVKISYKIHNGQIGDASPLLGEWELLSLEDMINQWNIMKKLVDAGKFTNVASKPIGPVKADWWNIKWIPITYNGAGDLYCLDLDPAPGGEVGQIISFWHMDEKRERLASNFREWLQRYADELENGKYTVEDEKLVVTD